MATLIPDFIHEDAPPGEKQIFATLRNSRLGVDWVVLHSLNLPRHLRQNAGEIDFLIMVPGKGILVLEVKSHQRVVRKNGIWHLGNDEPTLRGPFEQARLAMHSLKEDLPRELMGGLPFTYAVAFTHVRFDEVSTEWNPWQVIDRRHMGNDELHNAIENVLDENRNELLRKLNDPNQQKAVGWFHPSELQPTVQRIRELRQHLRGNFEIHAVPEDLDRGRKAEYRHFLAEQFDALDLMSTNQRILFEGPAGTGKTLLAIESASRSLHQATPTLVLCFNRMLANFLIFSLRDKNGFVGTLDRFVFNVLGEIPESRNDHARYFKAAAKTLRESRAVENKFGCIVIDEAQDICSVGALDLISEIIGQNPTALVRIFGDFEYQDIQIGASIDPQEIFRSVPEIVKARLTKNCRNRPGIGEVIHHVTGLRGLYTGYRLPDTPQNFDLEVAPYPVAIEHFEKVIETTLRRFLPGTIAILSCDTAVPPSAFGPKVSRFFTDDVKEWRPDKNLGISTTVRKFKGLDAQVVILTNIPADFDSSMIYTGISRAIEKVIILCPQPLVQEFFSRMTGTSEI